MQRSALLLPVLLAGCIAGDHPRIVFHASRPTDGAWAFSITDHSGSGQLLLDDRYRNDICRRVGQELRCEIRGLFPGGHSVELTTAGSVLRRTALVGVPWPKHPVVVRVRDVDQAHVAAHAGADAILYEGEDVEVAQDVVRAAHGGGARAVIVLPGEIVSLTGADAVWGRALDPETKRRFPETRELQPASNPNLVTEAWEHADRETLAKLLDATGLVEIDRPELTALGLLAPAGMVVAANNLDLVRARKKQSTLRHGTATLQTCEERHVVVEWKHGRESLLWVANLDPKAEWRFVPTGVTQPLDLLGGTVDGDAIRVRPNDFSLIVKLPGRDPSRL